jgi:hypothetical protein
MLLQRLHWHRLMHMKHRPGWISFRPWLAITAQTYFEGEP